MQKNIMFERFSFSIIPFVYLCASANAEVGIVVAEDILSCDYFVVETNMGFTLLEWYGGTWAIWVGDVVYGDLHSYGMKNIDIEGRGEMRVWVDDYWASEADAARYFYGKCNLSN